MYRFRTALLAISSLALFVLSLFLGVGLFRPRLSGVNIVTNPSAKVIINGKEVGRTPFRDFYQPGQYLVRLVPDTGEESQTLDKEINLERGTEFVIRHSFGSTTDNSNGYYAWFEKTGGKDPSLSVVSSPDVVQVHVDGSQRSQTPYFTSLLPVGSHKVTLKKDGFMDQNIDVDLISGYLLNLQIKMAPGEYVPTASPTPTLPADRGLGFVEVKNTPTGFLRIRSEASSLGQEIGRALPGQTYLLTGVDLKTGWFEIEFETESDPVLVREGWISNQYAERVQNP